MATNNAINQVGILPSFMYVNNADQTNVTGDGTTYTVVFPDKIYDKTNSFDGTSTFTAPLTGIYSFSLSLDFTVVPSAALNYYFLKILTTAAEYRLSQYNYPAGFPFTVVSLVNTIICPMTAGDTATATLSVTDTAKDVTIRGATALSFRSPIFSGYMISGI